MTEEQILNAIADACEDSSLRFQIIIQDRTLHVYINRPTPAELDYPQLKSKIQDGISKISDGDFAEVWLYCRVLGEVEADWQSRLEIEPNSLDPAQMSQMMEAITDAVEATNSIVSKIEQELEIEESFATDSWFDFEDLPTTAEDLNGEFSSEKLDSIDDVVLDLDLQKYCFIRNQRLLYAVLAPPPATIARLIATFDRFEPSIKRSQLPVLEIYFERLTLPNLEDFASAVQIWWTKIIKLDSEQQRQLAIWLSRYCLHPEATIAAIAQVFVPLDRVDREIIDSGLSAPDSTPKEFFNPMPEFDSHPTPAKSGLFSSLGTLLARLRRILHLD